MKLTQAFLALICTFLLACSEQASDPAGSNQAGIEPASATPELVAGESTDIPKGRLSGTVQPIHYRIDLTVIPEDTSFSGHVEIDLDIKEPLARFYIHGRFLDVTRAQLITTDGQTFKVQYEQVDDSGVARISLPQVFSGEATLSIEYTTAFNQALSSFYSVKANDKMYAFTQFEAISAREAFPGFDEPAFKVPFDISMTISQTNKAVSNTPVIDTEILEDGMKRLTFATTKPLPTYLVAFAVGDFDIVEAEPLPPTAVRDRPIPLRAITVSGKGALAAFSLDNTRGIVEVLEEYFGIPYPYAKLDILAVPDFAAGAMENAGAITYRDSLMLVASDATPQIKRMFYQVHAHELAHQWFGDLVTPLWWDDIWLNEAFATWMAYVALDIWRPDDLYRRDLSGRGVAVMDNDSKVSARQIRQPILSNHDISNAFDGITYSKGSAVLSMFETLLGREAFREGIQAYIKTHAWGTATATDFIEALAAQATEQEPAEVASAFQSFLEQPGLPLLEVNLHCESGVNRIQLSQSRYLPLGSKGSTDQTWEIPVCLTTGSGGDNISKACLLLSEAQMEVSLPDGDCPAFVMPNAGGAGYYRWSLDQAGWRNLLANSDVLSVEEMMSLSESLDGAFNAGKIDIAGYMDVAQRLAEHDNWRIATAPMDQLEFIYHRVANEAEREQLRQQYADLYGATLDRTGLTPPTGNEMAQLQSTVVDFLALEARLPELREELKAMAYGYTAYPETIAVDTDDANSNLIGTALVIAVQDDDSAHTFSDHLQALALSSDDAVFRNRALFALGHSINEEKRQELLSLVFSQQLRNNEIYNIITPQMEEQATRESSWVWLRENLEGVMQRMPDGAKGRLARYGTVFCDADHKAQVEEFFGPRVQDLAGGPRSLESALETIDLCMAKAEFHKPGMAALKAE